MSASKTLYRFHTYGPPAEDPNQYPVTRIAKIYVRSASASLALQIGALINASIANYA